MNQKKENLILIIRLSALGDVAMSLPVLLALKQQNEDVKIGIVSRPFFEPLFHPLRPDYFFEARVSDEHKGLTGLWRLYRFLIKKKPQQIADFHNVLRSRILALFFNLSGLAVSRINKGRKAKKALTRAQNKRFLPLKSTHERYADVLRELGFKIDLNAVVLPKASPLNPEITQLLKINKRPLIGIAPFAAHKSKMYPSELMNHVIASLHDKIDGTLVFFGGGEHEKNKISQWTSQYPGTFSGTALGSLESELQLISHLDLMLSMDSANAHLAANFGVKTITLWGTTHPHAGFAPFRQPLEYALVPDRTKYPFLPLSVYGNKNIPGYEKVMYDIKPKKVVNGVLAALNIKS